MKKIIIILGTIVLGIWMISNIIMDETNGFAGQANGIKEKANTSITGISTTY